MYVEVFLLALELSDSETPDKCLVGIKAFQISMDQLWTVLKYFVCFIVLA